VTQPAQPEQGMQQLPPMQPIDQSNPILNEGPAIIQATPVNTAAGQRLALTIRTPTTTLTILLIKDDAGRWRDTISDGIGRMNGLIVANGALPKPG
jgi:hypothetical protein